ncbi:hypothetical protein EA187_09590 [Lujinxingia sediminis]|uniref:Tetratricopeptide repeat protein n=1 Tax=Lujinxingia sediminis TaxID=2480984 RepID=A0ABY0CT54_9DELT|nr:hypothetical protein [Lujinxingia sediminis]RVU44783.1 hypothetical protein EA187_09590 [Lujinxingia sediminis]
MNWKLNACASFCAGIMSLGLLSEASAQDGFNFDVDEVEAIDELPHLVELIEEGKRLYEDRKYAEASLRFNDVLMDDTPGAENYYPEAEYELAKTLFRMELYQGSLAYFSRIVEAGEFHPFYDAALRGLLLLTEVIPGDAMLAELLAGYAPLFPEVVPQDYRDTYAYLVGRHFYETLNIDESLRMLNYVSTSSDRYARARYIAGITHVANYDARPAVDAFRDVLRYLTRDAQPEELRGEERRLLDLTHLGMARVYYSTGDYDTSLSYYERIKRDSPRWPDALFESSWGFFQVDQFNQALGNLHTINSPFFRNEYFPEGPILAAVIYFYNCNFARVRDVLDDFDYVYEGVKAELEGVIATNNDPALMYEWARKWEGGDFEGDAEVRSALRAALSDRQIEKSFALVGAIDKELETMEQLPASWKTSTLGDSLLQEAAIARSFAVSDAGQLAQQRLERVIGELEGLVSQQKRILFEVARSERGEIEAELRAGMQLDDRGPGDGPSLDITDEHLYWEFDGEYWKDELGFYFFNVKSECRR